MRNKKNRNDGEGTDEIIIEPDNREEETAEEDDFEDSVIIPFSRSAEKKDNSGNKGKRHFSPIRVVIVIVIIFMIVFVAADVNSGGVFASVNGLITSFFTKGSAENFSASTDADSVYDFRAFDNGYAILTENGISYVNSSGSVSAKQQLTYSVPAMDISGNRVLIYDRGGTSYSLQRNKSLYAQQSAPYSIIDAAVSSKNNYALAVAGDNAKTILYGYDSLGNVIYQWDCPDGYITDITLISGGGKAAAAVINSSNAVLYSSLYILDFEYDTAYADFTYEDETIIGLKFISNTKLLVVTDKYVYLINKKEQEILYDYSSVDICYCDIGNGDYTALITTDHSNDEYYSLTVFGKTGKLLFTADLTGRVRGLSCSDKFVSVLFSDKIETYTRNGSMGGSISGIKYFDGIVASGNYVYVLSSENVKKYPAYGTISYSEINEEESTD
ncbi:MAG: DUF5711 family protein [Clostridiales bacterium]|nr:DUF5711 family protein [Clostridiales bacterium]